MGIDDKNITIDAESCSACEHLGKITVSPTLITDREVVYELHSHGLSTPGGGSGNLPVYNGAYTVTPSSVNDLKLLTANKMLTGNIVINKIPYAEVSNTSNGTTVTIGSEV